MNIINKILYDSKFSDWLKKKFDAFGKQVTRDYISSVLVLKAREEIDAYIDHLIEKDELFEVADYLTHGDEDNKIAIWVNDDLQ